MQQCFKLQMPLKKKFILKKNVILFLVDIHGEYAAEKMALGHLFDGKVTSVFGSHTHIPTADQMICPKERLSNRFGNVWRL